MKRQKKSARLDSDRFFDIFSVQSRVSNCAACKRKLFAVECLCFGLDGNDL